MDGQGRSQLQTAETGARALESLLGFWSEAGVDIAIAEEPVDRLAERIRPPPAPSQASPKPASAPAGPDVSGGIAEARRLAAEADDLPALAAAIAAFDGCGLKFEGARQAVFSRGVANAPVMVIGEAPGADEDAQGQPFVGRAGKLLDKMLGAAGLTDRVFITNTVFWRPSGNRNPTVQEQMVCGPFVTNAKLQFVSVPLTSERPLVKSAPSNFIRSQPPGFVAPTKPSSNFEPGMKMTLPSS